MDSGPAKLAVKSARESGPRKGREAALLPALQSGLVAPRRLVQSQPLKRAREGVRRVFGAMGSVSLLLSMPMIVEAMAYHVLADGGGAQEGWEEGHVEMYIRVGRPVCGRLTETHGVRKARLEEVVIATGHALVNVCEVILHLFVHFEEASDLLDGDNHDLRVEWCDGNAAIRACSCGSSAQRAGWCAFSPRTATAPRMAPAQQSCRSWLRFGFPS